MRNYITYMLRMESSILVLVGYYETSLHTLLVTEYLEGGELFNKITDSSYCLTERKCRGFIKQIIQGLNYIHQHGIIHLDIKPQNIMLTHPNRDDIKLIDFGLAKLMKDGKIFASFTGTIGFMAPEVLNCSQAGPGTDFFSLGVVAYMLLSGGYEPFWLNNDEKTIKRTLHMEIKYLQMLSPSANSFLSGLLAKQLTERLQGLPCLSHPWVQGIQEEQDSSMEKIVNTMHIKSYMARTRWGKAIRAVRFAVRMKAVVVPNLPGVYPVQYPDFISTEIPIYV
ncbi:myosin light chain kinase, smooth muscle [Eurytemora carolleeae]|uniref:myosin light chain kinase, smooth muscle n=1 Tax=Eurytemora carolleeae TaxID=1294199 RepID=UPI000C75A385|nr:myosin light chain kinase, smooth muscle [Eurytemora carolleeae]|eukprot:XP_023348219.1 myosin light chain kinase, smooth muscle-like [Eurytemora affinis]